MKAQWQEYSAKFAALMPREKLIVAVAAVVGIGFLGFNFGVEPKLLQARMADKAAQQARSDAATLQAQLLVLTTQNLDPDAPNRTRLDQLKKQLMESNERLAEFQAGMVSSERMQLFLEGVLRHNRNIELIALKTLPAAPVGGLGLEKKAEASVAQAAEVAKNPGGVFSAEPAKAPPPLPGIYQHGMEITLAGNYNDLLNYLAELERMPQRVMWNSISLKVDQYPRNVLTLRVYTLSLDKNWLTV